VASRNRLILHLIALTSISALVAGSLSIASAQADQPVKIAIAYEAGGRGDRAANDAVAMGVDLAKKNLKLTALDLREMVTDGTEKDRSRRLRFLANAGYTSIIAVGSGYENAVNTVSMEFPDLNFSIIDDGKISNLNVESLIFDAQQGSYLAGVLAASASKTNKIGFVGDFTFESSPAQAAAFTQGAKSVKPKIIVTVTIPLIDTPAAALSAMHSKGVDVVYSNWVKNSTLLSAMISLNSKAHPFRLIGVLPDQYWLQSSASKAILIGAFTKHLETAAYDAIWYARKGQSFGTVLSENPNIYGKLYNLTDAGVGMALVGEGQNYSATIKAVSSVLKSGKIKIASF
jgi:basic membrane protein A